MPADIAALLAERCRSGLDVFAYFNNDPNGDATRNAATLTRLLTRLLDADALPRGFSRSASPGELTGLRVGQ